MQDVTATPLPKLPNRVAESHKGTFGKALLVGGARGMSGAITLAGLAALRGGAGLVAVAMPESLQPLVAAAEPSYLTVPLSEDQHGFLAADARGDILKQAEDSTSIGIGPGLGRSNALTTLVCWLYSQLQRPMVIDADALNALAQLPGTLNTNAGPRLLTPHPGEFSRLTGRETSAIQRQRVQFAGEFAARYNAVLVLKGHHSVITDGRRFALNLTGNPGMATGGTGDVLTGILTALLAQGMDAFDAARVGCYIHGLAGDLAAAKVGLVSLIASDLIPCLGPAFMQFLAAQSGGSSDSTGLVG